MLCIGVRAEGRYFVRPECFLPRARRVSVHVVLVCYVQRVVPLSYDNRPVCRRHGRMHRRAVTSSLSSLVANSCPVALLQIPASI